MDNSVTVTVYEFELYDPVARRWAVQSRRGTAEAIAKVSGVAVHSSALVVLASRLDEEGFLESSRHVESQD